MSQKGREIADELFALCERDLVAAHISDGIAATDPSVERVCGIARGSLKRVERVSRTLRDFLERYETKESE